MIRKYIVYIAMIVTLIAWIYLLFTGIFHHQYDNLITVLYQLSLVGLSAIYFIELSEEYEHGKRKKLLFLLCIVTFVISSVNLIFMFKVDASLFMKCMKGLMVILIAYSLFKVIKRFRTHV